MRAARACARARRSGAGQRRGGPGAASVVRRRAAGLLGLTTRSGSGIAGVPASGDAPATGLERIYADRLTGHPSATLASATGWSSASRPCRAATCTPPSACGCRTSPRTPWVAGWAAWRWSSRATATSWRSAASPSPPRSRPARRSRSSRSPARSSTHLTSPAESSPRAARTATLSGVQPRPTPPTSPAAGRSPTSFAESCNSVFAPLGAKLGAKRLVATAERFGFNEKPVLPAQPSRRRIVRKDLKDDLATGSAAIGQSTDLATPFDHGVRGRDDRQRRRPRPGRASSAKSRSTVAAPCRRKVAATMRDFMIGVVRGGTGTAAALPGVTVAGKTGTAELVLRRVGLGSEEHRRLVRRLRAGRGAEGRRRGHARRRGRGRRVRRARGPAGPGRRAVAGQAVARGRTARKRQAGEGEELMVHRVGRLGPATGTAPWSLDDCTGYRRDGQRRSRWALAGCGRPPAY